MASSSRRDTTVEHRPPRQAEPKQTDRLRDDIDRGRTGDKVPASDPAAAPLGTDDEAGGTPADGARTRLAERQRIAGEPPRRPGLAEVPRRPLWIAFAIAAASFAGLLLIFWFLSG